MSKLPPDKLPSEGHLSLEQYLERLAAVEQVTVRHYLSVNHGDLPSRQVLCLCMTCEGYTQTEIAGSLGLTQQRVSQMLKELKANPSLNR